MTQADLDAQLERFCKRPATIEDLEELARVNVLVGCVFGLGKVSGWTLWQKVLTAAACLAIQNSKMILQQQEAAVIAKPGEPQVDGDRS
jgi:hypothetical protein